MEPLELVVEVDSGDGGVLLVNLSKGELGEGPAMLLGSLLVSHIALAGLARAAAREEDRNDFIVYLDEFQSFTTLHLVTMLSELRKYNVGLVLAHQFLGQLAPEIRDAVLGNAGTLIVFRVGARDAEHCVSMFLPAHRAGTSIRSLTLRRRNERSPSLAWSRSSTNFFPMAGVSASSICGVTSSSRFLKFLARRLASFRGCLLIETIAAR